MLATTMSHCAPGSDSAGHISSIDSTRLRAAFSRVASKACGSMSAALALAAPSFRAARARMPEPQPKSSTVRPASAAASSHSRHIAVVGWVPVPNARPGSSSIATAAASGAGWPPGHTHSRRPKRMGRKSFSHSRSQARSSRTSQWIASGTIPIPVPSAAARRRPSVPPGKSALSLMALQSGVQPGAGSSTGSSPASASVTESAPCAKQASSTMAGSRAPMSITT
jgi:hypothetical protein